MGPENGCSIFACSTSQIKAPNFRPLAQTSVICVDIHIITPEKSTKNESANSKSACHATVHISMYASSNSASHIDAV